ncbi:unnamed protein product [Brachionus calyciflorus]|uniref:Nuclear-interacting partner of ALK n=1 Tax=Brachionus calyciflorus TaxID=104777 RepID=A0A813M3W5_9BILA|nr:unnamed protein product [Brachionus calyciflorus]
MESLNDSLIEYRKVKTNCKSLQSYEKYLQRLKTFELHKWFAKPVDFSPVECARRGWFNLNKDTLKCVVCCNILYHHSQSPIKASKFKKISNEKYNETKNLTDPSFLVEKHNQNCPWRTLKIPNQLILPDVYDEEKVYKNFLDLKSNLKKCSQLPILDEQIFHILDKNLIYINQDETSKKNNSKDEYLTKYILACCGWSYNETKDILQCDRCLRSVGLWLYKRYNKIEEDKSNDDECQNFTNIFGRSDLDTDDTAIKNILTKLINSVVIEEENLLKNETFTPNSERTKRKLNDSFSDDSKKSQTIGKKYFNPFSEHHNWCPWIIETEHKNTLILNFETLKKYFTKKNSLKVDEKEKNDISSSKLKSSDIINSDSLFDRIKSVQSILINCTSQLSQK